MTDPTEAIRKALEALEAYEAAFASGADQQTRSKAASFLFDELSSLTSRQVREIFDRLDSAERDQRRYQILRGNYLRVFMADKTGDVAFDIECEDPELNSEYDGTRLDAAIDAALRVSAVGGESTT